VLVVVVEKMPLVREIRTIILIPSGWPRSYAIDKCMGSGEVHLTIFRLLNANQTDL
jgi:hypothetical protein